MTRSRWVIAGCAVAAVTLVAALPPRLVPDEPTMLSALMGLRYYGGRWGRGDRHRSTVERTVRTLARHVRARQHGAAVVGSGGANRRSIASERESLRVVYDASIPPSAAREWLASAERELALYPRSGTGIPVVVELTAVWPYLDDRWAEPRGVGRMVVEGPRPMCLVTRFFSRGATQKNTYGVPVNLRGVVLDRCALYARYGLPGAEVRNWMGLKDPWTNEFWFGTGMSASLRRANWRMLPDTVKWFGSDWGIGAALSSVQCLRGNDLACETLSGVSPGPLRRDYWYWYDYERPDANLIAAHLIANRPGEAFARFWRSDLPVDSALAQAYGMPAGALVREAMLRRWVPPAPARVGPLRLLTASAWVLVALGLAWLGAWRKEIPT